MGRLLCCIEIESIERIISSYHFVAYVWVEGVRWAHAEHTLRCECICFEQLLILIQLIIIKLKWNAKVIRMWVPRAQVTQAITHSVHSELEHQPNSICLDKYEANSASIVGTLFSILVQSKFSTHFPLALIWANMLHALGTLAYTMDSRCAYDKSHRKRFVSMT